MLQTKNLTPQQLSAFMALVLSSCLAAASQFIRASWVWFAVAFGFTFFLSYGIFLFTLQRFINRRIMLIYKFIFQTMGTRQEKIYSKAAPQRRSIDEVSEDVEQWAIQSKDEIDNLRRNEKFRKEFLLNLAHELKTPVFSIQGYVHTLLDGAIGDSQVNRQFLSNASKNIDRLCNLIDDLDEISKLESGEVKINKEIFVIQDLVKDVFDTLSLKANRKEIRFSVKKGCESPSIYVYADKEKIRQVLINLLDNSIKYGKLNGSTVAGFYALDGQRILVEISDDGLGISEEHMPRIFERFYRTDRARSRDAGGTGLGLAIVKHIIEAHGQTINARSKPDIGSTFVFTLEAGKD